MTDQIKTDQKEETRKPPSIKLRLLYDLRIAVWAVLALMLVVLLILEFAPVPNKSNLTVSERVTVASEIVNVQSGQYVTTVSGALYNPTDEAITVDSVLISITAGKSFRGVDMEGFVIHPRTSQELFTSWVGGTDFNNVSRITVKINGEEQVVINSTSSTTTVLSGALIFYLIVLAIVTWFLVRASKLRFYLHQEAILLKEV